MIIPFLMIGVMIMSCEDEDLVNGGNPEIRYIRVTTPTSSDSLISAAFLGDLVAIMGNNLGDVREVWFNDRQAGLRTTLITNTTIILNVPSEAPLNATDELRLKFKNGQEIVYDFEVRIPPPLINSMDLEFVDAGDIAVVNGNYFFDVTPVTVEFTSASGRVAGEVVKTEDTRLEVIVPEDAITGPIYVTTNFGETESTLFFRDNRNIILNFDDKRSTGAWRTGTLASADGLDGNYLLLKGELDANERSEDYGGGGYVMQYWGQSSGAPAGPFFDGVTDDYVLKFEARILNWYGSYMNICFAPWDHKDSNQEYWSNSINARGIWGPWDVKDKNLQSNGWITVTIPMSEMRYAMGTEGGNVVYTDMKFDKAKTGSLAFWVIGSPKANNSPVEINIDNVRIVKK